MGLPYRQKDIDIISSLRESLINCLESIQRREVDNSGITRSHSGG
jgi:hypothetical protein